MCGQVHFVRLGSTKNYPIRKYIRPRDFYFFKPNTFIKLIFIALFTRNYIIWTKFTSYGPYHMFVHLTLEFRNGAVSNVYHIIIIIMPNKVSKTLSYFSSIYIKTDTIQVKSKTTLSIYLQFESELLVENY